MRSSEFRWPPGSDHSPLSQVRTMADSGNSDVGASVGRRRILSSLKSPMAVRQSETAIVVAKPDGENVSERNFEHGQAKAKKMSQSGWSYKFCQFVVRRNKLAFGVALTSQSVLPIITLILYLAGADVLPIDFSDIPMFLTEDASFKRSNAWNHRNEDPGEPMLLQPSFLNEKEVEEQLIYRQHAADYVEMYYEVGSDENILTGNYLRRIARFEQSLNQLPFYDRFCVLEKVGKCRPVDSILLHLPASLSSPNSTDGYNDTLDDVRLSRALRNLTRNATTRALIADYLGFDAQLDVVPAKARRLRSFFRVSWTSYLDDDGNFPPKDMRFGINFTDEEYASLPQNTRAYASNVLSSRFWQFCVRGLPPEEPGDNGQHITFYYYNVFLYFDRLKAQCYEDQLFLIGSLAFIASFMWLETRSLFITVFGVYFIMANFVGGNLLYRYVFNFRYFGVFNALAVFLILAVGIDEIFVFNETWAATADHQVADDLAARLLICYRKCGMSIFVPTLTTTVALLQNATCPLMALSAFGAFASCIVVLNYISIVTYFPCILIFHHLRFGSGRAAVVAKVALTSKSQRITQRLCSLYCNLLQRPTVQAICLMLMTMLLGLLTFSATNLRIDSKPPKLYIESHPLGVGLALRTNAFGKPFHSLDTEQVPLHMVWGISDYDRSMCNRNEWKTCKGKVVWDENFDLNPFTAQQDLLRLCRRLRSMTLHEKQEMLVRMNPRTNEPEITCFMDNMDEYFNKEMTALLHEENKQQTGLPSSEVKVEALMLHVPQIYNISDLLQNRFFYRYFEIFNLYWLNDGYKFLFPKSVFSTGIFTSHALLLGHSINASDLKVVRYNRYRFVYGTKLRYVAVVINTTIPREDLAYDEGLAILDKWERFFNEMKSTMQTPCLRDGGFLIAPDTNNDFGSGIWHWLRVQQVLITSAWQGVIIGIALALPILIVFTDNLIVGTLTTLVIGCASVSVIGIIPLTGLKLGLLESLNLTLVADLAIDHIVHVAEGYQLSTKVGRKEKVKDLLQEAGVSIISGAFTTIGASIFLLFTKIVFFKQFGMFILLTVAFSVAYAMAMLVVLLALIGPEDDRYSVSLRINQLKNFTKRRLLKYVKTDPPEVSADFQLPEDDRESVAVKPEVVAEVHQLKENQIKPQMSSALSSFDDDRSVDKAPAATVTQYDSVSSGYESSNSGGKLIGVAKIATVAGQKGRFCETKLEQVKRQNSLAGWSVGSVAEMDVDKDTEQIVSTVVQQRQSNWSRCGVGKVFPEIKTIAPSSSTEHERRSSTVSVLENL